MRIELYTHGLRVSNYDYRGYKALSDFARRLAIFGKVRKAPGVFKYEMIKIFASATGDRKEFRFHINHKHELLQFISNYGFTDKNIEFITLPVPAGTDVEFDWIDPREPRGGQPQIIEYLTTHETNSKLVTLQTGKGKSFLGMTATRALGKRTILLIKPMYFKKWIKDVKESFNFKKEQLITIQGGDDLRTVIELARADALEAQFMIMSNTTYQNYLADFEENNGADNYLDCRPEKLFETLGVGLVIIDEAHQLFHLIFRFFCYSNIANVISLSATIVSGNPQVTKMYQVVWPEHTRAPEIEYDKFINVSNIWISVNSMKGIRTKNAMGQYSQNYLEESIIKNPTLLANYTALIADIVRHRFIEVAEGVQKALVFCGTVDMCTNVTEVLKESFPDKRIVRYVSGDPFEEVLEADITVSTIQSAGTAVDIPNLRVSLMTVALDSVQSNVQVLGRTRHLKDFPEISPEFLFLTIREIEAHVRYANNKVEQFRGKVKSFKNIESSYRI